MPHPPFHPTGVMNGCILASLRAAPHLRSPSPKSPQQRPQWVQSPLVCYAVLFEMNSNLNPIYLLYLCQGVFNLRFFLVTPLVIDLPLVDDTMFIMFSRFCIKNQALSLTPPCPWCISAIFDNLPVDDVFALSTTRGEVSVASWKKIYFLNLFRNQLLMIGTNWEQPPKKIPLLLCAVHFFWPKV